MSQPSANTLDTLNGMFKERYAKQIENLIPDGVKLMNEIPFSGKEKMLGNLYHQPVILGLEHGVTFASSDDDAFNLNAPVAGQLKDAQVRGNPVVLRSVLGYTSASRAAQGGEQAFENATKYLVANMIRSLAKKLEIEMLYGQIGYGVVGSTAGALINLVVSEFAAGIWAGAEQMTVEIRNAAGTVSRGQATVVQVNIDGYTITLDQLPAGTIPTDVIWHKGAYGNEFAGVQAILANTGTLFNISAASYNLWQGNTYNAGSAQLSFTKVQHAIAVAVGKGLDSDVHCFVNPKTWADLMSDEAALRRYDSSYSDGTTETGSKAIEYYGQNGKITIEPSIYVKEGYSYILAMDEWSRIGSTDVTFKRPGKGDEFFRDLENSAGYELRAYSDQALFCAKPAVNVMIINIVNSA
jgi:hypothetical protein